MAMQESSWTYLVTAGVPFVNSVNPGNYPADVAANAAAGVRAEQKHNTKRKLRNMRHSKESCKQKKTSFWKRWIMNTYLRLMKKS
jgi:hypothetical protein